METRRTTCAVIGGGPAGMVMGLLLARAGVEVTVLEKHGDFLRDFRGDTVHPTTLRLIDELGLWKGFEAIPHTRIEKATIESGDRSVVFGDFARLRQPHPYLAMVPQWDLLNLLAEAGRQESTYSLHMHTEVTDLLWEDGRVAGVTYRTDDGEAELRADLTVACDGRGSLARASAGLTTREFDVPFDVWWFRVPRSDDVVYSFIPRTAPGRALILIPRPGYFQVAYLIPKGRDAELRARGLDAFRADLAEVAPEADVDAITSWDDVKLLDVRLNRLRRWYRDGLLCIGDAAHAMSPAGGVGINLAIQDAVAAATKLAEPLRRGTVTTRHLAAVQRRRTPPTVATQRLQRVLHRRLLGPVVHGEQAEPPRLLTNAVGRFPRLSVIPARVIGVGIRPERAPSFARRPN